MKVVERFPDTKAGQEDELGQRFAATLTSQTGSLWTSRPLDEYDHDFLLIHRDCEIEVQEVEIAAKRDFLTLIPPDQVKNATHEFTSVFVPKQGEVWGIDRVMMRQAIWRKIAAGHREMRLDTLDTMHDAQKLYRALGFTEIAAYYDTPIENTVFMSVKL